MILYSYVNEWWKESINSVLVSILNSITRSFMLRYNTTIKMCHAHFIVLLKCPLYQKLLKNVSLVEKAAAEVQCAACKRLVHDLRPLVAKKAVVSPRCKASWTQPSSCFKMKYLLPSSLQNSSSSKNGQETRKNSEHACTCSVLV